MAGATVRRTRPEAVALALTPRPPAPLDEGLEGGRRSRSFNEAIGLGVKARLLRLLG